MSTIISDTSLHHGKNGRVETPMMLVVEMLDQIPLSGWMSATETFCFPACGDGAYVKDAIRRLKLCGHSWINIISRIWVYDISRSCYNRLNYLLGDDANVCGDFLEEKRDISFDYIVGNPPFQNKDNDDNALWLDFLNKSIDLLKDGGTMIFISPNTWIGKNTRTKKANYSPFMDYQLDYVELFDKKMSNKFFPGIGSTFSWFSIIKKEKPDDHTTTVVSYNGGNGDILFFNFNFDGCQYPAIIDELSSSIHDKLIVNYDKKMPFFRTTEMHGQKLKKKNLILDDYRPPFVYLTYYSKNLHRYSANRYSYFTDYKVMVGKMGRLGDVWLDNECNTNEDIYMLCVSSESAGQNVMSVLSKNIYKYIDEMYRTGRNINFLKQLPLVDLSRSWTDHELYQHFNLTPNEIDYIEKHIS